MSTTNNELIRDRQHWVELRENACAAGFASPCQQASTAYRLAEGVDKDVERANQLLDRAIELGKSACMNGDSEQCRSTAHAIAHGRGVETDFPAAAQFLREACSADVPDACRLVASERIAGELFDRDPERGEKTLKELCSSGETRACFEFALIKRIGVVDLDLARSLEIFEEVCDEHGWLAACANAGFGYARGLGTQRDPERTAEFLSIACDENGGFACGPLVGAMMVFQPDELGDLNLLEVATESCERGKPYSCMAAGQLLQNGFQVEVDLDRARDFYATACEQKAVPACSRLRVLDMAQDADGDAAHLEKTCEDGTARSCLLLAMKHEFSSFDPDRLSRATRYYFQACQADNADGCTLVDRYEPINGAHLDTETASDLLERSCEHGSALQCLHAGLVLRQMNWPLSIEQYRSACDRGEEEACRHLLVNGYAVPETKSAKGD